MVAEDERSIANRLAREEQRSAKNEQPYDPEAELSKKDPTAPVCLLPLLLSSVVGTLANVSMP
jgi:hypothetical protein